ncbi:MAG: hypothetical protein OXH65_03155 [Paracoccaceae bacterium]|nr:hypothetical protein [Paracoccaceae bacterium]
MHNSTAWPTPFPVFLNVLLHLYLTPSTTPVLLARKKFDHYIWMTQTRTPDIVEEWNDRKKAMAILWPQGKNKGT